MVLQLAASNSGDQRQAHREVQVCALRALGLSNASPVSAKYFQSLTFLHGNSSLEPETPIPPASAKRLQCGACYMGAVVRTLNPKPYHFWVSVRKHLDSRAEQDLPNSSPNTFQARKSQASSPPFPPLKLLRPWIPNSELPNPGSLNAPATPSIWFQGCRVSSPRTRLNAKVHRIPGPVRLDLTVDQTKYLNECGHRPGLTLSPQSRAPNPYALYPKP